MIFATVAILSSIFLLLSAQPAHAIIVIVPTVLIPIVNIVVLIVGAISTPVIGLIALYFKIKKKPLLKGVLFGLFVLLLITVIMIFVFKVVNPQRPILNNTF